mmetsp:Transcript_20763/g.50939  ORF Transcript_20763/g.50939 Transcript_20763/m.50939 type:complete len:187 (-) Transcript_20763:263-823(-)
MAHKRFFQQILENQRDRKDYEEKFSKTEVGRHKLRVLDGDFMLGNKRDGTSLPDAPIRRKMRSDGIFGRQGFQRISKTMLNDEVPEKTVEKRRIVHASKERGPTKRRVVRVNRTKEVEEVDTSGKEEKLEVKVEENTNKEDQNSKSKATPKTASGARQRRPTGPKPGVRKGWGAYVPPSRRKKAAE